MTFTKQVVPVTKGEPGHLNIEICLGASLIKSQNRALLEAIVDASSVFASICSSCVDSDNSPVNKCGWAYLYPSPREEEVSLHIPHAQKIVNQLCLTCTGGRGRQLKSIVPGRVRALFHLIKSSGSESFKWPS